MRVVDRLAGVLLEVEPLDADALGRFALGLDVEVPLADDRVVQLADLVALRQVGVEIVLAVEAADAVDLGVEREPGADRLAHALAVQHGEHPRHGGVDQADLRVGGGAEARRGAAEQLRLRRDLGVDLEPDDDLPVAGGAADGEGGGGHRKASGERKRDAYRFAARSSPSGALFMPRCSRGLAAGRQCNRTLVLNGLTIGPLYGFERVEAERGDDVGAGQHGE